MDKEIIKSAIRIAKRELLECLVKINILYDVINNITVNLEDLDNKYYKKTKELIYTNQKQRETLELKIGKLEQSLKNLEK